MAEVPPGWDAFIASMEPHLSPDWVRNAREHAGQSWVRLIVLVDAHAQLSTPRIAEKIAMTMADLAHGRDAELAGWNEVQEKAKEQRMELISGLVDLAPDVLPEELVPLFVRSVDPITQLT